MQKKNWKTADLCLCGLLTAVAFVFSYLEWLLPEFLAIPGAKPGFANVVVVFALLRLGVSAAGMVNLVRILLVTATFGNGFACVYSLAGAALSLLIMVLLRKMKCFGVLGISVAGGVCHNIGQLLVAILVFENASLISLLPYLMLLGMVTGACVGVMVTLMLTCLPRNGVVG